MRIVEADARPGTIALLPELFTEYAHHLGGRLAEAALERARQIGYGHVRLDTLASLTPALSLYRSLGFREIAPYYPNPLSDVVYLELTLWPH